MTETGMTRTGGLLLGIKIIIGFHVFSLIIWFIGQTGALVAYDTVAEWGLQDPRALLDPAVVQVNKGIALADTIIMLPLMLFAIIGLAKRMHQGAVFSWLVFGMTWYWPVVFWCSQHFYARGNIMHAPTSVVAIILPAALMVIAGWGACYLWSHRDLFH